MMLKKYLSEIKSQAFVLNQKTDEELLEAVERVKKLAVQSSLTDLKIVSQWFALVQEVAFRKIGLKHFDTQLMAGFLLHEGKIVEMRTGEGKTLSSTLPVSLNALTGKGVHVVTVNEYLAERDKSWMGKVYKGLNLSVGLVKSTSSLQEKKKSYGSEITYLTNSELVFDYLRDSSSFYVDEIVQRPFNYCILDEIDSILIDEARTPLILSSVQGEINVKKLYLAKIIIDLLEKDQDFEMDEKRREINLTEKGYEIVKKKLGKQTLYDLQDPWILEILNALKAKYIFKLNKDYIVLNNKILIVDEFTGRVMEDRRWSMGIHEAIEMKENLDIGNATRTKSSITYQNFFTLYPKLAGMTGTAKTAEKEFKDIYNLDVVVLPTAKPMVRKDLADFVYQNELAKWKAVLNKSKECFERGQPILIGTASVEKSEFLSDLFKISKIPHQILNAKPENITRESEIVGQAGEPYAITIATNMAGRGTDIILGGSPEFKVKQMLKELLLEPKEMVELTNWAQRNKLDFGPETNQVLFHSISQVFADYKQKEMKTFNNLEQDILNLPYSLENVSFSFKNLYEKIYQEIYREWEKKNKFVKELGGLFVLGTERHETRRIDNQLRGRSGRQGDMGLSQFFVSLDDELIKIFGGENIRRWLDYLLTDKDLPLESGFLTESLENAQKKVESYNYEIRKNIFQYDDILNLQRKQLFEIRSQILSMNLYNELGLEYSEFTMDEEVMEVKKNKTRRINALFYSFEKYFKHYALALNQSFVFSSTFIDKNREPFSLNLYDEIWISNDLHASQFNLYELGFLKKNQNTTLLSILDFYWTEHIERMNYIRETISWRSYGQQNPLIEYNIEAFNSYKLMLEQTRRSMLYYFLENPILK